MILSDFKNPSFEEAQRILHSEFDIETHRQNFINYLEIVIYPDGKIEYAIPSHVLKLTQIYGKSSDEVFEEYMKEGIGIEPATWLCNKTGCLSVWNNGYTGTPNPWQYQALQKLAKAGLYTDCIPVGSI